MSKRQKLTPDQLKEIETYGYLDLNISDVCHIMKLSTTWLKQIAKDADNPVQLLLAQGKTKAKILANQELMRKVKSGDFDAVKYYLQREDARQRRNEDRALAKANETTIHVRQDGIGTDKPQVLISIPSNGREANN